MVEKSPLEIEVNNRLNNRSSSTIVICFTCSSKILLSEYRILCEISRLRFKNYENKLLSSLFLS